MDFFRSLLIVFAGVLFAAALLSLVCFYLVFFSPGRRNRDPEAICTPRGAIYDPFREQMVRWILEARRIPHENVSIRSFDGLTLRGRYYEYTPSAPVELMFHGYRGTAERDLCGGVQRCFALGHSALIVDQRAAGTSDGRVITFGVRESRDCRSWVSFLVEKLGPEVSIILTGISMGASTVMMAAGEPLPRQVVGVLADCGYTSGPDIIRTVMGKIGLPAGLLYPFVALGARLFGGFDLHQASPERAMGKCSVPVIFFHGESDDYVPCEMSRRNYEACRWEKRLVTVAGAGHGLSYVVDPEGYLGALREFFGPGAPAQRGEESHCTGT